MKGSPTCTADRWVAFSSEKSAEAKVAPWIPSRPVLAPTYLTALPIPAAFPFWMSFWSIKPTLMALTKRLPE